MKKIAIFSFFFLSFIIIFFLLTPIKSSKQYSNLFKSYSFGEFQEHERRLQNNLTDCFNIKLGFVYETICKKILANTDQLLKLPSDIVEKRLSCANGVFIVNNIDTKSKICELSMKFRIINSDNYYLLKISLKPFNKIRLIKIENGKQIQLENQNTLLWDSRDIRDDIFAFYFKKYLLIMAGDRLIAFYSCLENSQSGWFSFTAISYKNTINPEILHSSLDASAISSLEQELMFSHLISDSGTYHWNVYYPEHLIPFNGKKHEFIQRVEIGNITKPSILIPSGSKATWNLEIKNSSNLRVSISLVDKYIINPERINFKINIKEKLGSTLSITDKINWRSLTNHLWKDLNIDLSAFSDKKITVSFQTEISGARLPVDDNIVSIWGNPEIVTHKTANDKNIILIILDSVRPDHLSGYGYQRHTSPTIDALAKSGVLFKSAITAAPWTLPSHMSIFTGLYPSECGYNPDFLNQTIIPQCSFPTLSMGATTLAEYLSDNGYSTAAFTGGGMLKPEYNFDQGFHHFEHLNSEKSLDIQISDVIDWLKDNLKNKLFVTIHTYDTHCPYTHNNLNSSRAASLKSEAIESYDREIFFADTQLKRLMNFLKSERIFDDTLIIVMSDHGENFNPDHLKSNEGNPCGSHGETLYDCELKIPLIMTGAGISSAGMFIDEQVRTVDILPTVLDILHIETEQNFRGRSLLPIIKGKKLPVAIAYSEGVRATNATICNKYSIRTNNYKLIRNVIGLKNSSLPEYELYDLDRDPDERTNLTDKLPSVLNNLIRIMSAIRKDIISDKSYSVKNNLDELHRLGYIDN
jgi:arylsulfatase A-like enzyme